jgi:hypothetical protein
VILNAEDAVPAPPAPPPGPIVMLYVVPVAINAVPVFTPPPPPPPPPAQVPPPPPPPTIKYSTELSLLNFVKPNFFDDPFENELKNGIATQI